MLYGNVIAGDSGARAGSPVDIERAWQVLAQVMDPEVPVVSVVDLGIIREVDWQQGHLLVSVTPTYSGCPATDFIEEEIKSALEQAGFIKPKLKRQLSPAWTTDWITLEGKRKLQAFGIAPPANSCDKGGLSYSEPIVKCPQCGSAHTAVISQFGSTACKALYRCNDCAEPFDYFKCI